MFLHFSAQNDSPIRDNGVQSESPRGCRRARSFGSIFELIQEDTPLLQIQEPDSNVYNGIWSYPWFPGSLEDEDETTRRDVMLPPRRHAIKHSYSHRSIRRRIFLLLTEPTTSYASAIFFVILIIAITMSNVIMIMQTMNAYQFTPDDCVSCGGKKYYEFGDDTFALEPDIPCVCPPAPLTITVKALDYIIYFFTVEWSLRVLCFEPPSTERAHTFGGFLCQWLSFLTEPTTVLDALVIFPYYIEMFEKSKGLLSLRLLRLFRVFQLVRLGQYNSNFLSLTTVLYQSLLYLKLMMVVLLFGAAFFGSMIYWLEKGDWKYYEKTQSYMFLRTSVDGSHEEPSPFTSIPAAFWWFLVTATTVGYGDMYPTTVGGKFVAAMAMLTGVLVIAFPVSVFADLWSHELQKRDLDHADLDGNYTRTSSESPIDKLEDHQASRQMESTSPEQSGMTFSAQLDGVTPSPTITEHENNMFMAAEDVAALTKHIRIMEKSQERIRCILAKYDIE